jgi:hypothetical protein
MTSLKAAGTSWLMEAISPGQQIVELTQSIDGVG